MSNRPSAFKLTYSTMFDPPPELHRHYEEALARARGQLGQEHPMWIAGEARKAAGQFEVRSPINCNWVLGRFQRGTAEDVTDAVAAAKAAWPAWAGMHWQERLKLLRRAASLIEERIFEVAAAVSLEVGKNRLESLSEIQETADLIRWYCDQMEANHGFLRPLPADPLKGYVSHNRSVLKPYGVWGVIAPFNFPHALAGGPAGAALVAGNTVVFKAASDTPWSSWLLAEAFRDAGLPEGVCNFLTGGGDTVGAALVRHPDLAGITFTGSYEVGMHIYRTFAGAAWPRPCIVEMGGKNAAIVSRKADLDRAATGIVRSAFGLQGQKCSACSRVYVEAAVAGALREKLVSATEAIQVGDPTDRANWMGPVINREAYAKYRKCLDNLERHGTIYTGGRQLTEGALADGYYCAPTVASAPHDYRLWREEKFVPIVLVGEVDSLAEAITRANASNYGLTAGFYGRSDETEAFLAGIEAGVAYVNRPQGATTGAWPGYQPFGGWKGSGSTGKAIGSFYYLQQYLREQSQTVVE